MSSTHHSLQFWPVLLLGILIFFPVAAPAVGALVNFSNGRQQRAIQNIIGMLMEAGGGGGAPEEPCTEKPGNPPCVRTCYSSNLITTPKAERKVDDWTKKWADKKCPTKNESCILAITLASSNIDHQTGIVVSSFRGCESDLRIACDNNHKNGNKIKRVGDKWYLCCAEERCNMPRSQLSLITHLSPVNEFAMALGMAFEIRLESNNSFVFVFGNVSARNPRNLDYNKQFFTLADYDDLMSVVDAQPEAPTVQREFYFKHTNPLIIFGESGALKNLGIAASRTLRLDPFKQQIARSEYVRWLTALPTLDDTRECRECKENCVKKNKPQDDVKKCVSEECGQISKFHKSDQLYVNCA